MIAPRVASGRRRSDDRQARGRIALASPRSFRLRPRRVTFHMENCMHPHLECLSAARQLVSANTHFPRLYAAMTVALVFPLCASAQSRDDLWEVTMKMEIAGMPMQMPAQTNRV